MPCTKKWDDPVKVLSLLFCGVLFLSHMLDLCVFWGGGRGERGEKHILLKRFSCLKASWGHSLSGIRVALYCMVPSMVDVLALSLALALYGENMPDYPKEWN